MSDCGPTNCSIIDGPLTNGSLNTPNYDPDAPVYYGYHNMELATICITVPLTLIVVAVRLWYRRMKLKRFRVDDIWMVVAAAFLIPTAASQIGTNVYGGGLHMQNVPYDWNELHWYYSIGWCGYYIVTSCIKLSVCFCFLQLLPRYFKALRYGVYVLCGFIASLGVSMVLLWLFECQPFLSNFLWDVDSTTCINHDMIRWIWIAFSIVIDFAILLIPVGLLRKLKLQHSERRILKMVFSATLLGTATCAVENYGVWANRTSEETTLDFYYTEVPWVMLNDIEMLMYAIGASFPVLSRYLISRRNSTSGVTNENFSWWEQRVPDFFPTNLPLSGGYITERAGSEASDSQSNGTYKIEASKSADGSQADHVVYNEVEAEVGIISHKSEEV